MSQTEMKRFFDDGFLTALNTLQSCRVSRERKEQM